MRGMLLFGFGVLTAVPAAAQLQPAETFKSGVTMVQVPVVVRDHDGYSVGGLTKDDFELFDNGKRQEIASFAAENTAQSGPDRSAAGENVGGATGAIPSRSIAYVFDDLTIRAFGDLQRIRDAAERQVADLQPSDRAAIYTSSCTVAQDFTNEQAKLQEAIAKLQLRAPAVCRVSRVQIVQVELLKAIVDKMSSLPGRRDVILISSGFFIGHDRSFEETALIEVAIRGKVSIHAIDTGEMTTDIGGEAAGGTNTSQAAQSNNPSNPEVLIDLAHGTRRDLCHRERFKYSFRKQATPESHYVLGFVPTGKTDGKYHSLKVKLVNAHKLTVEARNGYFASAQAQ